MKRNGHGKTFMKNINTLEFYLDQTCILSFLFYPNIYSLIECLQKKQLAVKTKKMRKTRRKKGGSPHKTIEESLLSKKIPQSIIDFEISKFLKPEDNYTLRHTEIIDFKPTIRYEFEYDEDSHYMDGDYNIYNFSGENFKLTNTRFDDNVKKRIDACVIYDAKLSQIEEKGKVTDLKPKIDVTVILSELKVKGQATRPPYENTNIVINTKFGIDKKSKKPDYKVTLLTSVGNKVLKECKNIYAHKI